MEGAASCWGEVGILSRRKEQLQDGEGKRRGRRRGNGGRRWRGIVEYDRRAVMGLEEGETGKELMEDGWRRGGTGWRKVVVQ
jgi:hypothetical protein